MPGEFYLLMLAVSIILLIGLVITTIDKYEKREKAKFIIKDIEYLNKLRDIGYDNCAPEVQNFLMQYHPETVFMKDKNGSR